MDKPIIKNQLTQRIIQIKGQTHGIQKISFPEKISVLLISLIFLFVPIFLLVSIGSFALPQLTTIGGQLACQGEFEIIKQPSSDGVYSLHMPCTDDISGESEDVITKAMGYAILTYTMILFIPIMVLIFAGGLTSDKALREQHSLPRRIPRMIRMAVYSSAAILAVGLLYPTLIQIAAPFACAGKTAINSGPFSLGHGNASGIPEFYCLANNTRTDITTSVYLQAFMTYAGGLSIFFIFINRKTYQFKGRSKTASSTTQQPAQSAQNDWASPDINDWDTPDHSPPIAPSGSLTPQQLETALTGLQDLHNRGIITDLEYQAKRTEILARM